MTQWKNAIPSSSPQNGNSDKTMEVTVNKEQIDALNSVLDKVNTRVDYVLNAARAMTKEMTTRLSDRRRDYDKECGYPKLHELDAEWYQNLHDTNEIAARVNEVWPQETWKRTPQVYVDENEDVIPPFEQTLKELVADLGGNTGYEQVDESILWKTLYDLDVQCGVGRYGVLYVAVDDGIDPRYPVEGWKIPDSNPNYGDPAQQTYPYSPPTMYGRYGEQSYPTEPTNSSQVPFVAYTGGKRKENGLRKLLYLQVYPESMAEVIRWETNKSHPRYGQPVQYQLCTGISDETNVSANGDSPPNEGVVVHWSRVVHVADNTGRGNKILGTPRCQQVYKRVLDLSKLYGGSAEMYWLGALPAIIFKSDPALGGDVDMNIPLLKDQIERLINGLQRHAILNGLDAEGLAPTVVDPRPQIEVQLEAICIKIKVPLRIFKGSERGELSSAQDSVQHSKEIRGRDKRFVTPSIICTTVSRFIDLELISPPAKGESYKVYWPDPDNESPIEKANVAGLFIKAVADYIVGGVDQYIPPTALLTQFFGGLFTRAEAQTMLEEAKKEYEKKKKAEAQAEQQVADQNHQRQIELVKAKGTTNSVASSNPTQSGSEGAIVNTLNTSSTQDDHGKQLSELRVRIDSLATLNMSSITPQITPSITVNNLPAPIPSVTVTNEIKVPDSPIPVVNNSINIPSQTNTVIVEPTPINILPTVVNNQLTVQPAPITEVRLVQEGSQALKVEVTEVPKPVEKVVKIEKTAEGEYKGTIVSGSEK